MHFWSQDYVASFDVQYNAEGEIFSICLTWILQLHDLCVKRAKYQRSNYCSHCIKVRSPIRIQRWYGNYEAKIVQTVKYNLHWNGSSIHIIICGLKKLNYFNFSSFFGNFCLNIFGIKILLKQSNTTKSQS